MVGSKDTAVLVEIGNLGGMVPLSFESGFHPRCFNRIVSSVYCFRNGNRDVMLSARLKILENNKFIRVFNPVDGELCGIPLVVLCRRGWEVVDGQKR